MDVPQTPHQDGTWVPRHPVAAGDLPDVGCVRSVTVCYMDGGDFPNRNASAAERICVVNPVVCCL